MRPALPLVALVLALAGCPVRSADERVTANPPQQDGSAPAPGCTVDDDCVAAAATCCDCPAFAVGVDDPASRACTGVVCPMPSACPNNVRAACDGGTCVLACVEMACPTACANGYQLDATGCLSCECAGAAPGGCTVDSDCVQARADCCGCARGGVDTAVLASEQMAYDAALGCEADAACPDVDVCEPGAEPRCVQGRCELLSMGMLPQQACGRPDLPPCPEGTVCIVNADAGANEQGVGVCSPS